MLGDSLNPYPNLLALESKTAQGLADQIKQIRCEFKVLSIWSDGKKHYSLISSQRKLTVKGE